MDAIDAILKRRSIRKYTDEPVTDEEVTQLLQAAMAAPSARNQQPWHFVVIRERATLDKIAEEHATMTFAKRAPLAVLICGDLSLEKSEGYWVQDCAAATENLLLAVTASGFGATWCGVYPRDHRIASFRALIGLPGNVIPFALVVIGHPADDPSPAGRYLPGRVHQERW